jgi:hypothetical protein
MFLPELDESMDTKRSSIGGGGMSSVGNMNCGTSHFVGPYNKMQLDQQLLR